MSTAQCARPRFNNWKVLTRLKSKKWLTITFMDAVLRALADGTRRRILALVWREERTAGDIAARFKMARPAISQHLGVLLACELISVRQSGTRRFYCANRKQVAWLRAELAAFWDDRLAQLKDAAEQTQRQGTRRTHRTGRPSARSQSPRRAKR